MGWHGCSATRAVTVAATTAAALIVAAVLQPEHFNPTGRSTDVALAPRPRPGGREGANVVMAMAYGYALPHFRVFVGSLRASGFDGDIVLFTDFSNSSGWVWRPGAGDPSIRSYLEQQTVRVCDFGVRGCGRIASHEHEMYRRGLSPANDPPAKLLRYKLYSAVARETRYANGLILVVDFRDTVFQGDPFRHVEQVMRGEWLRFYEESFPPNMEDSMYTYKWIEECWGTEAAKSVAKAVIVCSGATMGTADGIAYYSDTMLKAISNAPRRECISHDQRFHNFLLYTERFHRVKLLRAGQGEVYNLGYVSWRNRTASTRTGDPRRFRHIDDITEMQSDSIPLVMNDDGSIAPVLHQFDRIPWLRDRLRQHWGWGNADARGIPRTSNAS